ncbi:MAG: secretin N-terminal domain-containing protein [Pirellulaceae bacterium]
MATSRYPQTSHPLLGEMIMTRIVATLSCFLALAPLTVLSQSQPLPRTAVPRTAAPPTLGGYQPYVLKHATAGVMAPNLRRMLNDLIGGADVQVDAVNNRIFVGGSPQVQVMAAQLIQNLDRPATDPLPAKTPAPTPSTSPTVKGYTVPSQQLAYWINTLRQQYPANTGVRIATDQRTGQLLIIAAPAVHQQIAGQLVGTNLAQPTPSNAAPVSPAAPVERTRANHQFENITWHEFEDMLRHLWGDRLLLTNHENGAKSLIQMPETGDNTPIMQIDRRRDQLSIAGPKPMTDAWAQVAKVLDAPADSPRKNLQLVPVTRAHPDTVRKAVRLIDNAAKVASQQNATADAIRLNPRNGDRRWGGDLITSIFQPAPTAKPQDQPKQPAPPKVDPADPPGEKRPVDGIVGSMEEDTGAIGPVRIEFIESLGVFIVSGNKRDVERVTKIIEEIEASVRDTQPEIIVYQLKHVNNVALSELIAQIYTTVFGSWQSPVSITPLDKPNALLMIGRQESINSVITLIEKLDQPVPPATQIKVFRLQFMSAIDAERQLQQFYGAATTGQQSQGSAARVGLGPRIRVIADYRSNSIIVNAGPRDMAEITHFIESIDVEDVVTENQIKVFRLKNALANDLQPVLQEAITGQAPAQTGGATGGGAGGTSSAAMSAQSTRLSIRRIGEKESDELSSGILAGVSVTADANVNALIVRAPAKSMPLIEELINQLDQLPNAEAQIKVFQLQNGDSTSLTLMLQTLFGQSTTGGQTLNTQSLLQASAATAGGESSLVPLRFAVDVRTNSIIVSGSSTDLRVVEILLLRLDESDIETRKTEVFRLKNAPAAEVATAITNYLNSQRQLVQQQLQFSQLVSPFEQSNREVIVVAESVSNSLIVSATPKYFEEIVKVINDLDFRPKMVMVQVLIAEVELSDTFQFGVELGLQDSLLFDRGLASVGFPFLGQALGNDLTTESFATRPNLAGQAISSFAMGRSNSGLGYGGMVLSAANESVNVMIRALQDAGRIKILSRPQIMTLDNQEAFIQVGSSIPRITNSTITQFGGSQNSTTDTDVGLLLTLRPRVSPDGLVVMEISCEKSEVGPPEQGTPVAVGADGTAIFSPPIFKTTAQTVVSATSGQTVVFAGLMTKTTSDTQRAVPYLSDLPLIGPVFRFKSTSEVRTELLIIMTPHIIDGDEDLEEINTTESERMSWALSDVIELHGDVGLSSAGRGYGSNGSRVIYPDSNPTGRTDATPADNATSSAGSSTNSTWKKLFSGFNNNTDSTSTANAESGPRPEPSTNRSSQSNLAPVSPAAPPQQTGVLYAPTPQQPTTGRPQLPSQGLAPAYRQYQPGSQNQLIQQSYPVGAAAHQPVAMPYTTAGNQPTYPVGYQYPPVNGNPTLPPNGYPATQYIPAGYPIR